MLQTRFVYESGLDKDYWLKPSNEIKDIISKWQAGNVARSAFLILAWFARVFSSPPPVW